MAPTAMAAASCWVVVMAAILVGGLSLPGVLAAADPDLSAQSPRAAQSTQATQPAPDAEPQEVARTLREEVARASALRAFSISDGGVARLMFQDSVSRSSLELRNDGEVAWEPGGEFNLSYRWLNFEGNLLVEEGMRSPIGERVEIGATTEVVGRVLPPLRLGILRLEWDMVQEEVTWFFKMDPTPEPGRLVLVLPPKKILVSAVVPLTALLVVLASMLWAGRLRPESQFAGLVGLLAGAADLVWCGASLWSKPLVLYREAQLDPSDWALWATVSAVAALLLVIAILPGRLRVWAAWAAAAAGAIFVWADILYFRFFGDLLSASSILAAHQTGELGESIGFLAEPRDWVLALDLVLAIPVMLFVANRRAPGATSAAVPSRRRMETAILLVALIPGLLSMVFAVRERSERLRLVRAPIPAVARHGLYGFQVQDMVSHFGRRLQRESLSEDEFEEIVAWFEGRRELRRGRGASFGAARGMNLLLVQVESLQQFVVGLEVNGQEITPNLNRLSGQAIVFPNFRDQTSKGRSSDADFVNPTSLLPVAESVAYEYPSNRYWTLAHELAEAGYGTVSAIPFSPGFWNRQVTLPAYGFETNLFEDDFRADEEIGWGLNDQAFMRQMVPRLEDLSEPFLVWMATLSVHYPYRSFPEEQKALDLGYWENSELGNYLHGMNFFDRALGELFRSLEESGLLGRTVVALWGDHDSTLHLRAEFAHPLGITTRVPGRYLADRVPFMIWVPGGKAASGGIIDVTAGHADVAPTLLAVLGHDPADLPWMGRNLLVDPPPVGPVPHPRGNWTDGSLAFIDGHGGSEQSSCWDLEVGEPIPIEACRSRALLVEEQLGVAERVLRYDLQRSLKQKLEE